MTPNMALIDLNQLPSGTVIQCKTIEQSGNYLLIKTDCTGGNEPPYIEWIAFTLNDNTGDDALEFADSYTPDLHHPVQIITTDIDSLLYAAEKILNEPQ